MLAVCMMLCGSVCQCLFVSPLSFVQEICVSNHTQKQQKRQTIHKDSMTHQVFKVDDFSFNDVTVYL